MIKARDIRCRVATDSSRSDSRFVLRPIVYDSINAYITTRRKNTHTINEQRIRGIFDKTKHKQVDVKKLGIRQSRRSKIDWRRDPTSVWLQPLDGARRPRLPGPYTHYVRSFVVCDLCWSDRSNPPKQPVFVIRHSPRRHRSLALCADSRPSRTQNQMS